MISFARVLLEAERERFSWGAAIHCARGRLGHRPVRRVPDREVLAALVPERVLPFASGDSRKRGPGRVGSEIPAHNRGGEPKGERSQMTAAAPAYRARQSELVRRSALRLPFCPEAKILEREE